MIEFIPAIDLSGGNVVRLARGDFSQKTVYHDNPAAQAEQFQNAGATRVHIIDLDGAKTGTMVHWRQIEEVAAAVSLPLQVGGGIRDVETIRRLAEIPTVDRLILSTAAAENPSLVAGIIGELGGKQLVVSVDVRGGKLSTRGWKSDAIVDPVEFGKNMRSVGVKTCVYTDILQDGMLSSPNVHAAATYAEATGLDVMIAGGISSLNDIELVIAEEHPRIIGVISGRAIYEGKLIVAEAVNLCAGAGGVDPAGGG